MLRFILWLNRWWLDFWDAQGPKVKLRPEWTVENDCDR